MVVSHLYRTTGHMTVKEKSGEIAKFIISHRLRTAHFVPFIDGLCKIHSIGM